MAKQNKEKEMLVGLNLSRKLIVLDGSIVSKMGLQEKMVIEDWWIPDGQLSPTVPNRSNYIHWIEDLLSSDIIPMTCNNGDNVKGFDIGTGANCIYPLLSASLLGWSFVGSESDNVESACGESNLDLSGVEEQAVPSSSSPFDLSIDANNIYHGPPVLLGVVRDGEKFDFCMCNPPFFETMEEAGLNPKTSCGGTPEEMVCPGGEKAFLSCIIEDSVSLKQTFRWYTSMVGQKLNLNILTSKLWEDVQHQFSAVDVLHSIESFFHSTGASCKLNSASFTVDIIASKDHCNAILKNEVNDVDEAASGKYLQETSSSSSCFHVPLNSLSFCVSVFQQIPGTLLVKGSLQHGDSPFPEPACLATFTTENWTLYTSLVGVAQLKLASVFYRKFIDS
ncbi:hypothetical protein Q3G72_018306 [Acer saccharum]|nr:hypothetical protein Q3G72_018306 [Acer saccharum]